MSKELIVTCDFDQLEARIITNLSGDPGLVEAINSEQDFFSNLASQLYREPIEKADPRRNGTKAVFYSKVYGSGVGKMSRTTGIRYHIMKMVNNKFTNQFRLMDRYCRSIIQEAQEISTKDLPPYTLTELCGRRLYTQPGMEYQLVNYKIQGTASEYMQESILRAKREGLVPYMRIFIHDEIFAVAPEDEAEDIGKAFQRCMTFDTEPVKLTSEYKVIDGSWGKAYE